MPRSGGNRAGIERGHLRPDGDPAIATELLVGPVYFRLVFGGDLSEPSRTGWRTPSTTHSRCNAPRDPRVVHRAYARCLAKTNRETAMKVGLMAPQGWKGEYDGWDAGRAWERTVELARRRGARVRVAVGVRPLPHGARSDRRDHVRVVLEPAALAGSPAGSESGTWSSARSSAIRAHGQAGLDHRCHLRRPVRAGHRRRLEGGRVARVRLRLPTHGQRIGRLGDHLEVITRMLGPGRATFAGATPRSTGRSTSQRASSGTSR